MSLAVFAVVVVVVAGATGLEVAETTEEDGVICRDTCPKLEESVETIAADIKKLGKHLDETLASLVCPAPEESSEDVPENVDISDIKKAFVGTHQPLRCRDGFIQCGTNAVATCQFDNTWKFEDCRCVEKAATFLEPAVNEDISLPCPLVPDSTISFSGKFAAELGPTEGFVIRLADDVGNFVMYSSYRIQMSGDIRTIVLNTFMYSRWGTEERYRIFPFQLGKNFTVDIKRLASEYRAYAYGIHLYTFSQRSTINPTKFRWERDAKMYNVTVKYP